jgi:hypothetical protein
MLIHLFDRMKNLKALRVSYPTQSYDLRDALKAPNLTTLKYWVDLHVHICEISIALFGNLTRLHLHGNFYRWSEFPVLPNLEFLTLCNSGTVYDTKIPIPLKNLEKCLSLRTLKLMGSWKKAILPDFSIISRLEYLKFDDSYVTQPIRLPVSMKRLKLLNDIPLSGFQIQPEVSICLFLESRGMAIKSYPWNVKSIHVNGDYKNVDFLAPANIQHLAIWVDIFNKHCLYDLSMWKSLRSITLYVLFELSEIRLCRALASVMKLTASVTHVRIMVLKLGHTPLTELYKKRMTDFRQLCTEFFAPADTTFMFPM